MDKCPSSVSLMLCSWKLRNCYIICMIHFSTPEQLAAYHSGPANTVLWRGYSGIVAQDAQHKFCLWLHSVAYGDGHMQVISPVGSAGHIHLCADHPEGFDRYSPMVSRLLDLIIVDIFATSVALHIGGDTSHPMLREISHNLRSKRYT